MLPEVISTGQSCSRHPVNTSPQAHDLAVCDSFVNRGVKAELFAARDHCRELLHC